MATMTIRRNVSAPLLGLLFIAMAGLEVSSYADSNSAPVQHPPFAQKVDIPGISDVGKLNDHLYLFAIADVDDVFLKVLRVGDGTPPQTQQRQAANHFEFDFHGYLNRKTSNRLVPIVETPYQPRRCLLWPRPNRGKTPSPWVCSA